MNNYFTKTLLSMVVLFSATVLYAHDFEAVNEDGVTIYYNIISITDRSCEVTYKGTNYSSRAYSGEVKIPETVSYSSLVFKVTSIAESAFQNCIDLTSIAIPNSVTSIGRYAFQSCSGLISISIPNSVTSIDSGTFSGCKSMTSIVIPNSVSFIYDHAFQGCTSLTSIEIPNSVTLIYDLAFYGCTSLTSIEIPNSVTLIGSKAFYGCTGLTSIEIPNSVTILGYQAFYECTGLTEIILRIEEAFDIGNFFSGVTKINATLYVPKGTKEAYQAKTDWDFLKIDDGLVYHQLTLTTNEGGVITYKGETIEEGSASFEIREGSSATITVEPKEKYELSSLRMNGMSVKKYMDGNTFTADDIDSDVEIVATFDLINPYITFTPTATLQPFCSEKNLNFSEVRGLTAYIVTGFKPSANEILLTPVTEVPAGTGVMLKGEVGATYKIPIMTFSDYNYSNSLVGVLNDKEVSTGYVYDEQFKAVDGSITVSANTAYLVLPAATEAGASVLNCYLTDGPSVKGDMNGDGQTDISDVVVLVNYILGQ